jgi:hypothetical protein
MLVLLYSIFLNNKEGNHITSHGRRHIAEPRKPFVYVCRDGGKGGLGGALVPPQF